jgi:putative alpha-1,2-mannosidase
MTGGVAYIKGHVNDLHMNGGVVYNYGRVDDLHQNGGVQYDSCQQQPQTRVVYRDRVVENRVEIVKWKYRDNEETAHVRDLLDAAMEVNRRQAERIKELERIISEHRESETTDPWDVQPTQADCERLLKQFDIFTNQ